LTSVVAFNRGRQLILATIRGTIRLWNLEAGQPPTAPVIGHTAEITAVAVSPDGHYFATASDDTTVRIWDASTGKPIGTPLTGHSGAVNAVAFSPDSRMLASGGTDGNVLLWDVDTHRTLADPFVGFDRSGRGVDRVGFNADGQRVVAISVGDHGTVRSWPTAAKPADLCAKVTINMSHKQWNEWVSPDIDYIKVCPELPIAPD
jgi:WD40 repeat protein